MLWRELAASCSPAPVVTALVNAITYFSDNCYELLSCFTDPARPLASLSQQIALSASSQTPPSTSPPDPCLSHMPPAQSPECVDSTSTVDLTPIHSFPSPSFIIFLVLTTITSHLLYWKSLIKKLPLSFMPPPVESFHHTVAKTVFLKCRLIVPFHCQCP